MKKNRLKTVIKQILLLVISLSLLVSLVACGDVFGKKDNNTENNNNNTKPDNNSNKEQQNNNDVPTLSLSNDNFYIAKTTSPFTESELMDFLNLSARYVSKNTNMYLDTYSLSIDMSTIDTSVEGTYKVTVSYSDAKCEITVVVGAKNSGEVVSLSINYDHSSMKSNFEYGENFDSSGIALNVTFDNGETDIIYNAEIVATCADFNRFHNTDEQQEYTVTISYKGKTAFYTVYVAPKPADKFVGINIIEYSSKTTYAYGDTLSADDFVIEYQYSSIDENGNAYTYSSQTPPPSTNYELSIADIGGFNPNHGFESDQSYVVTLSYGNYTCTCNVTVEKAPAHITSAQLVLSQNIGNNGVISVPKGTDKLSENYLFNLFTIKLTYSYGDPVEIEYAGNKTDFIVDDTEYYRFGDVGNVYHIDLYYKGIRVKSPNTYEHECNLNDIEYGFDVQISAPESYELENTEYLFVSPRSTHKTEFYRGENLSESILRENLIINIVKPDGSVSALQSDEFNLSYDDSSFPSEIPIRISNNKITTNFEAYPLDITVSLSNTGLSNYGDTYGEIKYQIYRMPDRTIKSIVPNQYNIEIDYKDIYDLSSYVGLSFTVNYSDNSSAVVSIKEDGTFDNANFTNANIEFNFDNYPLPDEMFEPSGYTSDLRLGFDYCVYAYTSNQSSTASITKLAASAFFPSAAIVKKDPEIKGIYVKKSEACKIFYNENDTLNLSDYAVYCYYDYSKQEDVKLSETEYKGYIDTVYYINDRFTTNATNADKVRITFKYLPNGIYDPNLDYSINSSINSSGARIDVIVVPNGYSLYGKNEQTYAFENISIDRSEYILFIDNELSVNNLTFTAQFVNESAEEVTKRITVDDLPSGFGLYPNIDHLEENFNFNIEYENLPAYLVYTNGDTTIGYGKTDMDFIYAKKSLSAEYALDLSELSIKSVYNVGEEFENPFGNIFIKKDGTRIENFSKNLTDLLSVDYLKTQGVSVDGATIDYSEFKSDVSGNYTIKVQWKHYQNRRDRGIMLEASYVVTVIDQNTIHPFDGYTPENYDFVEYDSVLNADVYVFNRDNTFNAQLNFDGDHDKSASARYSLAKGICTSDNFNTNVLTQTNLTEYGYYTLLVYEENNPLVSYYYIKYSKPENIFETFSVNGTALSVYDTEKEIYTDCVIELDNPQATIDYTLKEIGNAKVSDASTETNVSSGELVTISGNSLVLSVKVLNHDNRTICDFTVTLVYNSPIKQIALNGVIAERINDDTESFSLTLPENTHSYVPNVSLSEGYTAKLSLMGLPLENAPVFMGNNDVNVEVFYFGNYVCTYKLTVNVSYPLSLIGSGITLYGKEFPFESQYKIPEKMNFNLESTNTDVRISVESISGNIVAVLNDNRIDIPLLNGRNDLVFVFNCNNQIYKKYVKVYKITDNDQSYSQFDISELTQNIEVRAFDTMGILVDNDTFYVPVTAENVANAAFDSIMVIADYSYESESTFNLSSIQSYSYCPETQRYAFLISFRAKNTSSVLTKRFYVYLVPTEKTATYVPLKIKLGDTLIDTNEFASFPPSNNVFSKSVYLSEGIYEYSVFNDNAFVLISEPILLASKDGVPNEVGYDTANCLYTDNSNGYETYMVSLEKGEFSLVFTAISGIPQQQLKFVLTIIIN